MAIVTTHLVSGRVPVVAPTSVTPDRYTYLGLSQAEPNLGYSGNGNVLTTNIYGQRIWSSNINVTNIQVTGTIVAGAVTASAFIGDGAQLTALPGYAYSNVNVKAYTETIGLTNYSNVNAISLVTSLGYTNYSNVNLIAYLGGSVTIGNNLLVQGNLTVIGNVSSMNVEYINTTEYANSIQAGNISAVTFGNVGATFTGSSLNLSGNVITTGAIHNALAVNGNTFISSLGVGTTTYGNVGEIRATNAVVSYYSDENLKTKLGKIENALDKVDQLSGFYYEANDVAQELGYTRQREVGVSAQETQAVLPEIVKTAPISDEYLTVQYERFAPLLIEAIKELRQEVNELKRQIKGE